MPSDTDTLHTEIEQLHSQLLSKSPIYNFLLQDIKFISLQPPPSPPTPSPSPSAFVHATLQLSNIHLNSHNSLHGAVAATIVDWVGGIVIASLPRHSPSATTATDSEPPSALTTPRGVSVDIHLRYLSAAAKLGDTLIIRAWSHKLGRSLAFVTVQLAVEKPDKSSASGSTSQICVVEASHTKYIS